MAASLPARPFFLSNADMADDLKGKAQGWSGAIADYLRHISACSQDVPAVRILSATALAILIWGFSSKALQDIVVFGACLFALTKLSSSAKIWKQPAGIAFIVVLIHFVISLPFSGQARLSLRDFSGFLEIIAGVLAIAVLFNTSARIKAALFYSAVAIAGILGCDIIRLAFALGPELMVKGHVFEPFVLNHANVASLMAGAAIFVFLYFGWIWRASFRRAAGCGLGLAICLAHMLIMASRGPQIAFALTLAGLGLLIPGWKGKLLWFFVLALAGGAVILNIERINPRFLEKSSMSNFSERDTVWRHTWKLCREHPWFGHGYGKRNFVETYYASQPPRSRFHYPHPHQFWLKLLFEFGWTGLILHLTAWSMLGYSLARCIRQQATFSQRMLPGTVAGILLMIHLYGMGDYPDHIVQMAQFWLVPVALALISENFA